MSMLNLLTFSEGEVWGIQLPSPKGMQSIRIRIVGQNQFGIGFVDDFDESKGLQFLSGAVPFMARRMMTAEEAKADDERRQKAAEDKLAVLDKAMGAVLNEPSRLVLP